MKSLIPFPALLSVTVLGLFLLAPGTAGAQSQKHPTLPAHPKQLLGALPKAPQGWKITRSEGQHDLVAWPITDVQRHYEKVVLAEGEDPNAPPNTVIQVRDTGEYPSYIDRFRNFVPDEKGAKPENGIKKVAFGSYPAFIEDRGNEGLRVTLLARARYIITLDLLRQPPTNVKLWLESVGFQALSAIPSTPQATPPTQFTVVSIDEIDPDRNSSYSTNFTITSVASNLDLAQKAALLDEGLSMKEINELEPEEFEVDVAAMQELEAIEREIEAEEQKKAAAAAAAAKKEAGN